MHKFLDRLYEETYRAYPPYLKEEVLEEGARSQKLERQYKSQVEEA